MKPSQPLDVEVLAAEIEGGYRLSRRQPIFEVVDAERFRHPSRVLGQTAPQAGVSELQFSPGVDRVRPTLE
jgi:hypothetical protein